MTSFLARLYAFKFFDTFLLIFPLYTVMLADAGLTPVQISACLIAWSATGFVLQVPSGVLADRWSRRYILAGAQLIRMAGFAVWLIVPTFPGYLAGLMLWGVKSAFTSGTFEALLYDELKTQGRAADFTRIYGRTRAVDCGGLLAAALGAAFVARSGYSGTVVASIASGGIAAIAAASLPPAPPAMAAHTESYLGHLRQGLAISLRQPAILSLLAFSAIVLALGGALEEFWPIFGAGVGLTRPIIAIFVGAQSAIEAGASLIAHRLVRVQARPFYASVVLGGALLMSAAGLFSPWAMLLLAAYSGLMKLVAVVFEGHLQHAAVSASRATIGSVKSFFSQVGVSGLYIGFGVLAQSTSYRIAFLASGGLALVIGLAYLAVAKPPRAPA